MSHFFSFKRSSSKSRPVLLTLLLILGTSCFAKKSWAQYGPFAELPGTWSGGGTVTFADGRKGRISCKADYIVGANGNELQQNLRCFDSFPINLESNITYRGGVLSGRWSESGTQASGELSGRAGGGHFDMSVHTDAFDASLLLTTYGNVQSVVISSNREMKEMFIRLVRSRPRR